MHKLGNFEVIDGTIFSKTTKRGIVQPTVIIDKDTGGILKIGEPTFIHSYWDKKIASIPFIAENCVIIEFNAKTNDESLDTYFNNNLTTDEICTLINYMNNSIGPEKMQQLFNMDQSVLKDKIESLQSVGF